jgi:hypothetical protein
LVEHVIRNDGVTGSSPVCGTILRLIQSFEIAVAIGARLALAFCRTTGAFDRPRIVLETRSSN